MISSARFQWSRPFGLLCVAVCLLCWPTLRSSAQSTDQANLNALVTKFFDAYRRENIDELMSLWSARSPNLAAQRLALQQAFAATGKTTPGKLTIRRITIADDRLNASITVEIDGDDKKNVESGRSLSRLHRTFHCIREDQNWKIWSYVPSEEELAASLAKAKTDDERDSLLGEEKQLLTPELQQALMAQGDRLFKLGSYPQALALYQIALNIAGQLSDTTGRAVAMRSIGNIHYYHGDYSQALNHYQESLKLAEAAGSKAEMGRALNNIGNALQAQSKSTEALTYYERSLLLAEELRNKPEIARTLNNMGNVYSSREDYSRALDYYKKSIALREQLGDAGGVSIGLYNIGQVLYKRGNYRAALDHYARSLELAKKLGRKAGIASILRGIGDVSYAEGNYLEALTNYSQSLKLADELGDRAGVATTLTNLGLCLYAEGNSVEALEYYRKSLKLAEDLADRGEIARIAMNMGRAYQSQGDYQRALEAYRKSLLLLGKAERQTEQLAVLRGIAETYQLLGNGAAAEETYETGLQLAEESGHAALAASLMNGLGNTYYSQRRYEQAREISARAANLAQHNGESETYSEAQVISGRSYYALKRFKQARQAFAEAINSTQKLRDEGVESERELQSGEDRLAAYRGMIALMVEQHRTAEAFAYAEMSKVRALSEMIRNGGVNITKGMTGGEKEVERAYFEELASLGSQIYSEKLRRPSDTTHLSELRARLQSVRRKLQDFNEKLYIAHPRLKAQRGETRPLTLNEASLLVRGGKLALLEFVATPEKTFLFVLTWNEKDKLSVELKVYQLKIGYRELKAEVENFRQMLVKQKTDFGETARRLYDLLLKPARKQLAAASILCIIPDGALWDLPFQALQTKESKYLLEDHAIFYAPSLSALREMRTSPDRPGDNESAAQKKSESIRAGYNASDPLPRPSLNAARQISSPAMLAFSNPTPDKEREEIYRLLYGKPTAAREAEQEVKALEHLPALAKSNFFTGPDACEEKAKAQLGNYQLLYFATPVVLDDNSPLSSHIQFSRTECSADEDGMLKVPELLELELRAEIAVFSASETVRGRAAGGEAISAMSWAFWAAGSPTLMVSRWQGDSPSTTRFMTEFYSQLNVEQLNTKERWVKARVMRSAALKMLKSETYNHPFYWARLMLVGEG